MHTPIDIVTDVDFDRILDGALPYVVSDGVEEALQEIGPPMNVTDCVDSPPLGHGWRALAKNGLNHDALHSNHRPSSLRRRS